MALMTLTWEKIGESPCWEHYCVYRARVPGGWLVTIEGNTESSVTFVPDPDHEWDGSSTVD